MREKYTIAHSLIDNDTNLKVTEGDIIKVTLKDNNTEVIGRLVEISESVNSFEESITLDTSKEFKSKISVIYLSKIKSIEIYSINKEQIESYKLCKSSLEDNIKKGSDK